MWWGLLVILLLVLLVNLVYLPGLVFIGITLINYNLDIMEYRNETKKIFYVYSVLLEISFMT